jgi:hypothetical protein
MDDDLKINLIFALVLVLFYGGIYLGYTLPNRITQDQAVSRFAELAQVDQSKVVVVRQSNDALVFGNTHDVSYELVVDGKHTSGRCTSGPFSQMVCRLYTGGE